MGKCQGEGSLKLFLHDFLLFCFLFFNYLFSSATKSCESLYSNNSSKGSAQLIYRAKRAVGVNRNNTGIAVRQPGIIRANNEVRQRVLSARRLRMKTYHNQLTDAQQTINVCLAKFFN